MKHTFFYPQHPMLDDLVTQFFGEAFSNKSNAKYPLTDVYEESGMAYLEIAVAGFSKDEIKISVNDNLLTVKGEKKPAPELKRHYIQKDIAKRNFEKVYTLMFPIETVNAEFVDGILHIQLVPETTKQELKYIEIK